MSSAFLAVVAVSLEVLPLLAHRLITNPYPQQEWDSVIVSSDPITIKDRTNNTVPLNPLHPHKPLKPQKRSFDCPENDFPCLYATPQDTTTILDNFFQHHSASDNKNLTNPPQEQNPRNSYWTIVDSQTHNHPFDDKTGWVTLDPVPWSTSKISKWHPNNLPPTHQDTNTPWDYSPTTHRPVQQFWVSGSTYHPQRPASQWAIGTNDIITDNKPTGFPDRFPGGHFHGYGATDRAPTQPAVPAPTHAPDFPPHHHRPQHNANRPPHSNHPSTYPSNGNGQWVLLSTTKGYSLPQRHRWSLQNHPTPTERLFSSRKVKSPDISKYHEEDLHDKRESNPPPTNRKSDPNPPDTPGPSPTAPPLQLLYTASSKDGQPAATLRRKVRLQVLPSLESSSVSHGGLLEVDSTHQTVDEAQQEEENIQKLKAIANVKKSKIRGFKLIPTSKLTGKGMKDKNVMTLAAVGAGMIPATMALLVPMALGRRRRRSLPVSGYLGTLVKGEKLQPASRADSRTLATQLFPLLPLTDPKGKAHGSF